METPCAGVTPWAAEKTLHQLCHPPAAADRAVSDNLPVLIHGGRKAGFLFLYLLSLHNHLNLEKCATEENTAKGLASLQHNINTYARHSPEPPVYSQSTHAQAAQAGR